MMSNMSLEQWKKENVKPATIEVNVWAPVSQLRAKVIEIEEALIGYETKIVVSIKNEEKAANKTAAKAPAPEKTGGIFG